MRLMARTLVTSAFLVLSLVSAAAQDTEKDLAAKASAELRVLTAFQTLERVTSQINHALIYAIQAERGGWDAVTFVDPTAYTNSFVPQNAVNKTEVEIARARESILKGKSVSEEELKSLGVIVESLDILIALAPQVGDMIKAGELDAAAALYHEVGHPAFLDALRGSQSSAGTVSKRLGKTLLDIRIAKQ